MSSPAPTSLTPRTDLTGEGTTDPPHRTFSATQEDLMTTTTDRPRATRPRPTAEKTAFPDIDDARGVSFRRLLGTELRKLVDTRSGRWMLIAILALTGVAMAVPLWIGRDTGSGILGLLVAASIPQAVLIPVLGIMTAANEWSQRTALITFTQEPRRLRVMAAKTAAAVLLGMAVLALSILAAILAHVASMASVDGQVDLSIGWTLLGHLVVIQLLGVLTGVAFGALLLSVPLGIVAYVLVPALSPLVFMATSWLRENAAWLDMTSAQAPLLGDEVLTGEQWAQVGTTSALWILLPLALGFWRVARKQVA